MGERLFGTWFLKKILGRFFFGSDEGERGDLGIFLGGIKVWKEFSRRECGWKSEFAHINMPPFPHKCIGTCS